MENDKRNEARENKNFKNRPDTEINRTNDNRGLREDSDALKARNMEDEDLNPEELATFPKQEKKAGPDLEEERDSHLTSRKTSPVREGRNITNTGPKPDEDGFM